MTVQAQNPGLNPQLLEKAIARYLPELTPGLRPVRRRELQDADGQVFDDPITRRATPSGDLLAPAMRGPEDSVLCFV